MAWKLDPNHTRIGFSVRHMMISTVRGEFEKFTVNSHIDEAEANKIHESGVLTEDDILNSHLEVLIEAASINTHNVDRDNHLRSPDFFDAAKYPTITFRAKRGEKKDDTHGRLIGDLTIRDVTREVGLDVEMLGRGKNPFGSTSAGFEGQAKINRKDWNLNWNVALEAGGWLVDNTIKVEIDVEFLETPEQPKTAEEPAKA